MIESKSKFRFAISDLLGITKPLQMSLFELGIHTLRDIYEADPNDLKYFINLEFNNLSILQFDAKMLDKGYIPNHGYYTKRPVIWFKGQRILLLDTESSFLSFPPPPVTRLQKIIKKFNAIYINNDPSLDVENSWMRVLKSHVALRYRIDHEYLIHRLTCKPSVISKIRGRYFQLTSYPPEVSLGSNWEKTFLQEINRIQNSLINYSKQSLKSSMSSFPVKRTANNPPRL